MPTIGFDSTTDLGGVTFSTSDQHLLMNGISGLNRTAVAGEAITEVGYYNEGSVAGSVEIGVYRTDTLALVASAVVSGAGGAGRKTTAVSQALTSGITYAVAFRVVTETTGYWAYEAENVNALSALTGSSALANPFVPDTAGSQRVAIFATTAIAAGPVISSPTPSGTLATQTTATIGCTTDNGTPGSNTLYVVVDSAANLTGITPAQIKAGNNNTNNPAVAANSAAVTTTMPSAGVSGLTAETLYSYAIVQEDAAGFSNVLSGTFTTAAVPVNPGIRITDIYQPNADTLVADASDVDIAVYDELGGTLLYSANNGAIVNGDIEIDSDLVGDVGDPVFVILRWYVSSDEYSYAATETVINLDA